VLAGAILLDLESRVVAAVPADHQIERVVLDADDDLVDQRSHDPLARLGCHAGT
jgi:hypothetical protein